MLEGNTRKKSEKTLNLALPLFNTHRAYTWKKKLSFPALISHTAIIINPKLLSSSSPLHRPKAWEYYKKPTLLCHHLHTWTKERPWRILFPIHVTVSYALTTFLLPSSRKTTRLLDSPSLCKITQHQYEICHTINRSSFTRAAHGKWRGKAGHL